MAASFETVVAAVFPLHRAVNLSCSSIGAAGAAAVAKAMKVSATLTTLDLGDNRLFDTGASALADAVKVSGTLTTFRCSFAPKL